MLEALKTSIIHGVSFLCPLGLGSLSSGVVRSFMASQAEKSDLSCLSREDFDYFKERPSKAEGVKHGKTHLE